MNAAGPDAAPDVDELIGLDFEVDPAASLDELRHGRHDPTIRFDRGIVWRASRTDEGPATTRIARAREGWRVSAWGPGARAAAATVPRLLGSEDDPTALVLREDRLRDVARRSLGLRFGRTDAVWPALLPAICGQKVTSQQAHRAYFGLIRRWGEDAPGPAGLRLPPTPEVIASLPYHAFHPLGLEQRRALTLLRAAERADRLEEAVAMSPAAALARLRAVPGIGVWTAAEVARVAFGDPDAVSIGDFHVPHMVCWFFAREPRGDDARMLELLEPYRGQRARVVRLLERAGVA
ncbi:MAG: DNA-3-methyladenine glycosylase 2 family protein, partial [Candidatus Limnocylindrales bacterium]